MELAPKTVKDSLTEQIQILMPEHLNGFKRLFGGKLVEWIDVVAAVVARRHSHCNVTTAVIDNLQFKLGAYVNHTLVLMEVRVDTFIEELDGTRKLINRAYLTLVALDKEERPTPVPGLILETEEEKAEWEAGKRRREQRKRSRAQQS